ncbi:hypothetical protein C8R43DRAFT_948343 [Mycena crocata]|nr:hypothetical protein C8R43DRAFT_948343 [Mycena crocata]
MHFPSPSLSFLALAVGFVHAAPGPRSSLSKRWCGFEHSCPCEYNVGTGCVPAFDECAEQWFWPPNCTKCAPCLSLCFEPSWNRGGSARTPFWKNTAQVDFLTKSGAARCTAIPCFFSTTTESITRKSHGDQTRLRILLVSLSKWQGFQASQDGDISVQPFSTSRGLSSLRNLTAILVPRVKSFLAPASSVAKMLTRHTFATLRLQDGRSRRQQTLWRLDYERKTYEFEVQGESFG